ncbi:MAG: glutamate racemase [Cytophagaceae bacterium]|jgi:glutamate racemase|nr:glutamate racemase [Cytophagaceae bacterium]
MTEAQRPIGIFDSGIGGLTVAKAVAELLPKERIVYFGDTAHLPYGDKSTAAIQSYAIKISDVLLKHQCKVILIACNSASAAAYQLLKEYTASRAKVMNVIDPMVQYVGEHFSGKRVGLIGTKRTIASNVYQRKVDKLEASIQLQSLATPLLAPMVEEGFFNNDVSQTIITTYLQDKTLEGIEALILGCTHYPLIKESISAYYSHHIPILDSSGIVAAYVKEYLQKNNLLSDQLTTEHKFYVSDYTRSFVESTKLFFQTEVELEHYPLWE